CHTISDNGGTSPTSPKPDLQLGNANEVVFVAGVVGCVKGIMKQLVVKTAVLLIRPSVTA
ncbi:MAG: hypothetical protein ACKPKO_49755, partial [Candidatus Fonsibacter sp.]